MLTAMIKAHEIQGIIAPENGFNRVGLDHVLLVRVASTAVATAMLGGTLKQVINAVSNAFIDGSALRTYRHAPNTGSRKSWAAGDATSRAVRHAFMSLTGEMGYPSALSAKTWGFCDVLFADRDHCIQYMSAIALIFGRLSADDYEDNVAADPRIDALRARTQVRENPAFTQEYYASDKRYIGNAIQVFFKDGTQTPRVQVDFPGHRARHAEGIAVLVKKFETAVGSHFKPRQAALVTA